MPSSLDQYAKDAGLATEDVETTLQPSSLDAYAAEIGAVLVDVDPLVETEEELQAEERGFLEGAGQFYRSTVTGLTEDFLGKTFKAGSTLAWNLERKVEGKVPDWSIEEGGLYKAVSYTHLTLPTKA